MKAGRKEFSFEGQTALVTGSAQGLGREIALALSQHGASLILADKVSPSDTARAIQETGGEIYRPKGRHITGSRCPGAGSSGQRAGPANRYTGE